MLFFKDQADHASFNFKQSINQSSLDWSMHQSIHCQFETVQQWTTFKGNFDTILSLVFSQENFSTEKLIPLVTYDKPAKQTPSLSQFLC